MNKNGLLNLIRVKVGFWFDIILKIIENIIFQLFFDYYSLQQFEEQWLELIINFLITAKIKNCIFRLEVYSKILHSTQNVLDHKFNVRFINQRGLLFFRDSQQIIILFSYLNFAHNKYKSYIHYKFYSMACRQIIEREGQYHLDHDTTRGALINLNIIHASQKIESDSIFYRPQSIPAFSNANFSTSAETKFQFSEKIFDVMNLSSILTADSEPAQYISQTPNSLQTVESEKDQEESSQFVFGKVRKARKTEKSSKRVRNTKMDKEKNIFPNIAKRTAKIMFQDCKQLTEKYFKKRNIQYSDFEKEYRSLFDSNCSGLTLSKYFADNGEDQNHMHRCFKKLFEKYLRKTYMLAALKRGKMEDVETYISCKNKQLMYFSEYMSFKPQARV